MANNTKTKEQPAPSDALALVKKDTVDVVASKVREFQERKEIHFPANYSPENAMKSAWLVLQTTQTKDKQPALEACTRNSIANALLDMVVQGLNPAKKQGYFIAYGNQLVFQRSYFGTMAVTKQATEAEDIVAQVVYEGDDFEYEIDSRGRKKLIKHNQSLGNIDKQKILAAYCTIIWPDGQFMEIMTIDQIKQAWGMSQMRPITDSGGIKKDSTHDKFTAEMALKTVINRACKFYINSSNDSSLVIEHFNLADEAAEEARLQEEIGENANAEIIDIEPEAIEAAPDAPEAEPGPEPETAKAKPGY